RLNQAKDQNPVGGDQDEITNRQRGYWPKSSDPANGRNTERDRRSRRQEEDPVRFHQKANDVVEGSAVGNRCVYEHAIGNCEQQREKRGKKKRTQITRPYC